MARRQLSIWSVLVAVLSLPIGVWSYVIDARARVNNTVSESDIASSTLEKRVSGVRFTWYDVETGNQVACGGYYHNNDAIVALSLATLNKAVHCGKGINIHYGGKTVHATIVDGCEECPPNAIDLTRSLFAELTTPGMVYGDWEFADAVPAPSPAPVPSPTQPPPPPPAPSPSPPKPTTYTPPPVLAPQPPKPKPTTAAHSQPVPIPSGLTDDGKKICRNGRPRRRRRKAQTAAAAQARKRAAAKGSAAVIERSEEDM